MRSSRLVQLSLAVLSLASLSSLAVACGGGSDTGATQAVHPRPPSMAPPAATKPDSEKVTWKQGAPLASCHNDVKTGADLVAGVTAMAQGCAGVTKMHPIGATVQGTRQNLDPAQAIPL